MVEVNPNLLGACLQIIDAAAAKGTFTGADLTSVGQIRAELVKVLEPLQKAAQQAHADGLTEVAGSDLPGDQKPN